MTPNPALMRHYGTEDVFRQKTAGETSLLERLAGGLLGYGRAAVNKADTNKHQAQAAAMNEMLRELELLKVDTAAQLLRGTPVPRFQRPSMPRDTVDDTPWQRDYDDGMVALASAAADIGADLAKEGGVGGFADFMKNMAPALKGIGQKASGALGALAPAAGSAPAGAGLLQKGKKLLGGNLGLGLKGNLALTGLAAGGLYLGNKGIQKATHVMGEEAAGPATYGGGQLSYQLPYGVNQYGQPQVGTPL